MIILVLVDYQHIEGSASFDKLKQKDSVGNFFVETKLVRVPYYLLHINRDIKFVANR